MKTFLTALGFVAGIAMFSAPTLAGDDDLTIFGQDNWEARVAAPLFPRATKVRLFASKGIIRIADSGDVTAGFPDRIEPLLPGSGVALSPAEFAELRANVWYTTSPHLIIGCYSPRHAFLFYDRNDKYLGYLRVCYECIGSDIEPSEAPNEEKKYVMWDMWEIAQIIKAHRMPILPRDEE